MSDASGPTVLAARPVQLQGSAMARGLLRLFGWRVLFDGLPTRQGVLIIYPHTSNWDFVIGMLTKWTIGFPLHFWGKDSLFKLPLLGRWVRWVGGIAVDRTSPQGAVAAMAERIVQARTQDEFFWLGLSPEGTRSWRESWRSGFYQLTLRADVPLALAFFDYGQRQVGIDSFIRLSGNEARDMAAIESRLGLRRGCRPENAAPVRLPAR